MTTAVQEETSVTWVRQRNRWARTTPGWLMVTTGVLVLVAIVTGAVAGLTVLSRSHALSAAQATTEPLVVDAQTVVVTLSDANTTVAGGFLSGPVLPTAARSRFNHDLAQESAALTAAAQRAGTSPQITGYLQALDTDVPVYTGIVATAEADNRQGQPVAAAYLAEANHFMDAEILPAASSLYAAEQARLSHDESRATSSIPIVVVIVLLVVLLITLVYLQVGLARRFRRLLNLGCLVAALAVLTLTGWLIVAAATEGAAVSRAERHGTDPLRVFTQARILASQARADDELTLVTRDADPSYQQDYSSVSGRLSNLIARPQPGWTAPEAATGTTAAVAWEIYGQAHQTVRGDDTGGSPVTAITFDETGSSADAAEVDTTLGSGVQSAVSSFGGSAQAAQVDLSGLRWAGLILVALIVIGIVAGTRPRLREYR